MIVLIIVSFWVNYPSD